MEKRNDIIRIAVTGPESTGKTTLAQQLAQHFDTVWVPEYVREYFEINGSNYAYDDLTKIAKGQLALENKMVEQANCLLFSDTEMLVMKIWSQYKFGKCDPWILNAIETHLYDLFLLCDIDLPWEYDPLRENPSETERKAIFRLYKKELDNYGFPYGIVSGKGEERIENAVKKVMSYRL